MGNLINNVITLDNDEKYIVINQAVYQNKNYLFVARVTDNEDEVLDEFKLLEEIEVNGKIEVQIVDDEKIINLLTKYFESAQ